MDARSHSRPSNVIPGKRSATRDPCGVAATLAGRMLGWTAPDGISVPE